MNDQAFFQEPHPNAREYCRRALADLLAERRGPGPRRDRNYGRALIWASRFLQYRSLAGAESDVGLLRLVFGERTRKLLVNRTLRLVVMALAFDRLKASPTVVGVRVDDWLVENQIQAADRRCQYLLQHPKYSKRIVPVQTGSALDSRMHPTIARILAARSVAPMRSIGSIINSLGYQLVAQPSVDDLFQPPYRLIPKYFSSLLVTTKSSAGNRQPTLKDLEDALRRSAINKPSSWIVEHDRAMRGAIVSDNSTNTNPGEAHVPIPAEDHHTVLDRPQPPAPDSDR